MISSASNSQVKNVIQLLSKSKERDRQNCFIIEGIRMYEEVPEEMLIKTYMSESFYAAAGEELKGKINDRVYELVEDEVYKRMSDTVTPQGIMAVVKCRNTTMEDIVQRQGVASGMEGKLYIVLEAIQDPGNLGTIVRTAEAAGVSGIIMSRNTVDIYNPKVVRSTMGSIFRVPFAYVEDIIGAVDLLKSHGITVYAAHLRGGKCYFENDYNKPSAFLIGNEGNGLTDAIADKADVLIRIPMMGQVESLNAGNAATILMYESLRQRISINSM